MICFYHLFITGQSPIDARGGQLEIAGVVVGSWGANIPGGHNRGGNGGMGSMSPRVMSVGGQRRGYPTRWEIYFRIWDIKQE